MKHKIPLDYNLEKWDPDKRPIVFLGAVFDANSIGKWICEWTFHVYGRPTIEAEASGNLWFLLILLTSKLRVSANFISESVGIESIEQGKNKDMVEDFIESGEHLMEKFKNRLKECEESMLRLGKKGTGRLHSNAGVAFVKAVFGSGKPFTATERLIFNMELWARRWEANCAEVVAAKPDTEQPIDDAVDADRDSAD